MTDSEILGPSGTAQTHEFLVSGCRYQWVHDHDSAHCWAAFLAFRGAPAGLGVDEYYEWLDKQFIWAGNPGFLHFPLDGAS